MVFEIRFPNHFPFNKHVDSVDLRLGLEIYILYEKYLSDFYSLSSLGIPIYHVLQCPF